MGNKTIRDISTKNIGDENTDQLTVIEKSNLNSKDLISVAYLIYGLMQTASWQPDRFTQSFDIGLYPGEKDIALTVEDIKECALSYGYKVSDEIAAEIGEMGGEEALYAKRERKNENSEFVCFAYLLITNG